MRRQEFCLCENSCAVTAQLISAFVFATRMVQFFVFQNPKFQAILCRCRSRFVSDLVGNPENWFSVVIVPKCHFGFFPPLGLWSGSFFLIAPFPDHCLLLPFSQMSFWFNCIFRLVFRIFNGYHIASVI